ncbi:MAG: hypothetical protein QOE58_2896 [Actinomycetota bacterium]|jgi:hypothetical protein|nr:hypothetical protein [Actinomycetota bacterium]
MKKPSTMRKLTIAAGAVGAVGLMLTMTQIPIANASTPSSTAAVIAKLDAYRASHPGNFAGLDALDRQLTGGGLTVSLNGVAGTLTGAQAQKILDVRQAAQASVARSNGPISPAAIPAFTVAVYSTNLTGPPPVRRYSGYWNFPDSWPGRRPR